MMFSSQIERLNVILKRRNLPELYEGNTVEDLFDSIISLLEQTVYQGDSNLGNLMRFGMPVEAQKITEKDVGNLDSMLGEALKYDPDLDNWDDVPKPKIETIV